MKQAPPQRTSTQRLRPEDCLCPECGLPVHPFEPEHCECSEDTPETRTTTPRGGRPRHITAEVRAEILSRAPDESAVEIAEDLGLSPSAVWKVRREARRAAETSTDVAPPADVWRDGPTSISTGAAHG